MAASEYVPIVLITGGNQGIGYETAKLLTLSPRRYHIIIGSRSLPRGEEAVAQLEAHKSNDTYSAVQLDITSPASIAAAAATVSAQHAGSLDVLVNNAAIFLGGPNQPAEAEQPPAHEVLRRTLDTNVVGTAAVTEAFLPLLRSSASANASEAKIVVLSSSLGSLAMASAAPPHAFDVSAYRVSKAAANMLVVEWAKTLAADGIRVWGADPGPCATNLAGTPTPETEELRRRTGFRSGEDGARVVVGVLEGRNDANVGRVVYDGGVRPW